MWLAYFFDAGKEMAHLEEIEEELIYNVLKKFAIAALILAVLIGVI